MSIYGHLYIYIYINCLILTFLIPPHLRSAPAARIEHLHLQLSAESCKPSQPLLGPARYASDEACLLSKKMYPYAQPVTIIL